MPGPDFELIQLEAHLARQGIVPSRERLPLPHAGRSLAAIGGVLLGVFVANFAVFIVFIICNYILHVGA
ncbi:MAG TPA: hypothetical protein VNT02_03805 [Burkholderiales bacterium]|nr:hypothetical protein [Burkholderiales bacterium]